MSEDKLIIRARRVVLPHEVTSASIEITNGRITSIGSYEARNPKVKNVDVDDDSIVMAGLVDTHVHVNSPGRTHWEGFETATRAAAAGGVTTLVDMPLNSIPPTTTLAGLKTKIETARDTCHVDVGFWGGVVPGNTAELAPMLSAGVVGFKCFLVPSGVAEFEHVVEKDLREAMPELTRLNTLLIVHAELPGPIDAVAGTDKASPRDYATFLRSRPRAAENEAVKMMIRLSREFNTRVHIVHLSSAEAIPLLRQAQAEGVRITAETCPHYLHLTADQIETGETEFKCCPPIREQENREQLWAGLADGTIGIIVSDHSPCPSEMKLPETGDFLNAWGGIASLQLRLPIVWTESNKRGFSLGEVSQWLCNGPAELIGFERRKGSIAVGNDADLVVWSPAQEFRVDPNALQHRHKISPYVREVLQGTVQKTFLRGKEIFNGSQVFAAPTGRMLLDSMY